MEEDGELEIEDYYFGQWDGIFKSLNSESIEFNINLWGWLVMDESGDLWFFPGDIDSMPEKKDGEWIIDYEMPILKGEDRNYVEHLIKIE